MFRSSVAFALLAVSGPIASSSHAGFGLEVSENRRYLVTHEGEAFFYLADTAWELTHRLDRSEIDTYLQDRASKQFNVIQTVILAERNGITVPNREGELPFHDQDPTQPNEAYFELIDYTISKAAEYGLRLAILPTWGSHLEDKFHPLFDNVHIFDTDNIRTFGEFLGARYGNDGNVIWVIGGDRDPEGKRALWLALKDGLKSQDPESLMTFHPPGGHSSRDFWPDDRWIDFDMVQSGHYRRSPRNWQTIETIRRSDPARPVFDGEPNYEGIPIAFSEANPRFDDLDVRKAAYWSVFAGSFGHTYGHNSIWQVHRGEGEESILWANQTWREALDAPGAGQMRHLRALIESRPMLNRIPAQDLLTAPSGDSDHVRATRDGTSGLNDATYAMVYLPHARSWKLDTSVIKGDRLNCWWFNPRTGEHIALGEIENPGAFESKWEWRHREGSDGPDWVFVIDDASAGYGPPGR